MHRSILVDKMSNLQVLFEDRHLICVVKPYGVLSQGDGSTHSICDEISAYLSAKGESAQVYVVHRLDKTTGGVMVFAKTKEVAAKLSSLVAENKLYKTYMAVAQGKLHGVGTLTDLLYHDKFKNKTYVVKRKRQGVKHAQLEYTVVSGSKFCDSDVTLLEIKLLTGRTHQIRVQFASRKHPLVGDRKYGSMLKNDTIALWSYRLEFVHPVTKESVCVSAKPDSEIFSIF